jgi:hypothetical protein
MDQTRVLIRLGFPKINIPPLMWGNLIARGNLQSGSSGMGIGNYGWNLDKPAQGLKGAGPC